VGHLPLMTAATGLFRRHRCPQVPLIGFSFNFTTLPKGVQHRYLIRALRDVDECVVYSRHEQEIYPALFDLDPARVRFLPWAMEPPVPGDLNPAGTERPYLCSIGGEGRDYALLARVMRDLPSLRMVVIARPYSIAGIDFPDNVQVFTNLPLEQTWRVARDSGGLVIPLVSPETACGHITLVGAQLSGIPLVITRSRGVADYVEEGATARLVEAGAADDLRTAIAELVEDPATAQARAAAARARARAQNGLATWVAYFEEKARAFGL
jgi:glycosyltransferase involved in cell wall biosynthesis